MSLTRGLVLDVANQLGGAEPSIVTLHDWSRAKNDGAMTNMTWPQLASTGLWVMGFDGSSSSVNCGSSAQFNLIDAITIEAWIRIVDDFREGDLIAKWSSPGSQRSYYMIIAPNGLLWVEFSSDGGFINVMSNDGNGVRWGSTDLRDLKYHHCVVTFSKPTLGIYVDGQSDGGNQAAWNGSIYKSTSNLRLAIADSLINAKFEGTMVLIRIYNYALTAGQVRARYHSTKWLFGVAS